MRRPSPDLAQIAMLGVDELASLLKKATDRSAELRTTVEKESYSAELRSFEQQIETAEASLNSLRQALLDTSRRKPRKG